MSTRKDLKPGDLVVEFSRRNNREYAHYALVIGVDYPKDEYHSGCEERIHVMWSDPIHFDTVCDCTLEPVSTFTDPLEKRATAAKKV